MGKFRDFWERRVWEPGGRWERGREWERGEWVGRESGWGGFEEVVNLALLPPHLSHPLPPEVEDGDFSILWDFVGVGSGQCGSVWEWGGRGVGSMTSG